MAPNNVTLSSYTRDVTARRWTADHGDGYASPIGARPGRGDGG